MRTFLHSCGSISQLMPDLIEAGFEILNPVQTNVELLSPGGGFVFNTIHNILPDVPPQNIVATFEAVNEYR